MGVWKNKKTGNWQYKFRYQHQVFKKEGFTSRDDAVQAEGRMRGEVKAPRIQTPSASFQQIATEYLTHCQMHMQKNTWNQKSFIYRGFLAFIGNDLPATSVTPNVIRGYLRSRLEERGPKAANRSLRDLSALYNWAIREELCYGQSPCWRVQKFAEDPYHPYIPPVEDVIAVKLAATPEERDFIETIYHAIARKGEVLNLAWDDVNFERRWVRLYTRKRRGGQLEPQYKPMNDTLYGVLSRKWKQRDKSISKVFAFTPKQVRCMMDSLCDRAGVKRFGFHAIRHHVLSVINDSGKASMKQIQELAGHKRQTTTEIYLHSLGHATRDAAAILDEKGVSKTEGGTLTVRHDLDVKSSGSV